MIRRLYDVEDRARPLDDAARRELRQAEAVPILERLRAELDRLSSKLLPKSALAQAVTYALNQWQAWNRYTQDGRLTIDNNVSERRLRDQAIGRKNWLFLGSDHAVRVRRRSTRSSRELSGTGSSPGPISTMSSCKWRWTPAPSRWNVCHRTDGPWHTPSTCSIIASTSPERKPGDATSAGPSGAARSRAMRHDEVTALAAVFRPPALGHVLIPNANRNSACPRCFCPRVLSLWGCTSISGYDCACPCLARRLKDVR